MAIWYGHPESLRGTRKKHQQTIQISFHILYLKKQQSLGKALEMRLLILFFWPLSRSKINLLVCWLLRIGLSVSARSTYLRESSRPKLPCQTIWKNKHIQNPRLFWRFHEFQMFQEKLKVRYMRWWWVIIIIIVIRLLYHWGDCYNGLYDLSNWGGDQSRSTLLDAWASHFFGE